jgi:hypothetical protein
VTTPFRRRLDLLVNNIIPRPPMQPKMLLRSPRLRRTRRLALDPKSMSRSRIGAALVDGVAELSLLASIFASIRLLN